MNWQEKLNKAFGSVTLQSLPDYSVKTVGSTSSNVLFGLTHFILPAPQARFLIPANTCYGCANQVARWLRVIDAAPRSRSFSNAIDVPACKEHADLPIRVAASIDIWTVECAQLTVFAERSSFLQEAVALVRERNVAKPPWVTFPKLNAFVGWNGAIEGAWLREVWVPYWRSASALERATIIGSSPPPQAWNGWEKSLSWQFMNP